jgi:hypothetical protein
VIHLSYNCDARPMKPHYLLGQALESCIFLNASNSKKQ